MKSSRIKPVLLKNADSIIAALAGMVIIFFFTRHSGIGISPDAVVYSSVAEHILQYGYPKDYNQSAVTDFPLLYPLFLSLIGFLTGTKVLVFAPVLNAFLFAIVIFLSGRAMNRLNIFSRWPGIFALSCIVISPCLIEIYPMLWSETVFILLLLIFIVTLRRYFQNHQTSALLIAAGIAALATVTRYAGITMIATGTLLLLLDKQPGIKKKMTGLIVFISVSPLLFIINLARNYYISGTLMGHREKAIRSLATNIHDAGAVFCDWLPFVHGHNNLASAVFVIVTLGFIMLWFWQFTQLEQQSSFELIATTFFLVYMFFIIASASLSRFEELNSRLLSPLFIPFVWINIALISTLIKKTRKSMTKFFSMATATIFFIAFQYQQLRADLETWDGVKDAGVPGYTEDEWKLSPTVKYVQQNLFLLADSITIYSNANDAIYFFTGKHAMSLPHKDFANEKALFLQKPNCYVVWFNNGENPDQVDANFISTEKKMKLFKQFADGAVYSFHN